MRKSLIDPEEALAIELNDIINLELSSIAVSKGLDTGLSVLVEEVLECVLRLKLVLRNQIVEVNKLNGDELLVLRQPGDLLAGLLHIALQVQLKLKAGNGLEAVLGKRVDGVRDLANDGVAPVHQCDLLVLSKRLSVSLLHNDILAEDDLLCAEVVLGVLGLIFSEDALARTNNGDRDLGVLVDGDVARGGGLDVLLVGGPEGVPVEVHDVLRRTLLQDELLKSRNDGTSAADTTDGRHARVIPAPDVAGVNDLGQLALGQHSADEVETSETPVVNLAELELGDEPLVLSVAVVVLGGTESVCDTLERIDDGAAEVVGRVHLPLGAGAVVVLGIAAVDDRVAHGLVRVIDRHLRADTPSCALLGALLHLLELGQGLLGAHVAALTGNAVHALGAHLLLCCVVCVGQAILDSLHSDLVELIEPVTGVRDLIRLNAEESAVLDDRVLELLLLLAGVCVVESEDELALVLGVGEVVVQKGGLCVSNVEVASVEGQSLSSGRSNEARSRVLTKAQEGNV